MDTVTELQIASLLKEADHAADPKTNGLLDRDELASIIRALVHTTRLLLKETDEPIGWPTSASMVKAAPTLHA